MFQKSKARIGMPASGQIGNSKILAEHNLKWVIKEKFLALGSNTGGILFQYTLKLCLFKVV
jgi:hypothetical protein